MNAGFEDCTILNEILEMTNDNILKTIELFSLQRVKDAHAISELAMYNYLEMRDFVNRPTYQIRNKFDNFLFWLLKDNWIPLYISVTFSEMTYSQCILNREWQNKVIINQIILNNSNNK